MKAPYINFAILIGPFFIPAVNQNWHKSSDEFEIRPDPATHKKNICTTFNQGLKANPKDQEFAGQYKYNVNNVSKLRNCL